MIGYVTLGSDDLETHGRFYDALLAEVGAKRMMQNDEMVLWGTDPGQAALCLHKPFDGQPPSVGNGVMVALRVESPAAVDRVHAKAIALGAKDEGAPGPRGMGGFYAAYFRDPNGNKLNVFNFNPA